MAQKKKIPPIPAISPNLLAVDTHCHLDMSAYHDDYKDVIERAFAVGVKRIITVGIDLESSKSAVRLAEQSQGVFATVGVHPHHAAEMNDNSYIELLELAGHPKVVAYGEIGLDMAKNYCPAIIQKEHFQRQVLLAKKLDLPLIIHDREAHTDVMDILQNAAPFPAGGVMHCFSGDMSLAEDVLALGFYISIPGVVTFNKAEDLRDVARLVSLDALLIETDGPFLTPVPFRGKRNEPAYVLYTAQEIARLRGASIDEIVSHTTINAERLFGL